MGSSIFDKKQIITQFKGLGPVIKLFYRHLITNLVFRNTVWMLFGYSARIVLQAIAFIFLARTLGPEGFGTFVASMALANLVAPFVEFGAYSLIVQDVLKGMPTNRAVGNSLFLTLLALPLGLIVVALLKVLLLSGVPWNVVLLIGLSTFLGGKFLSIAKGAQVAHNLLSRNSVLEMTSGCLQVLMVFLLIIIRGDLQVWVMLYILQNLIVGMISLFWVIHSWGVPRWNLTEVLARIRQGFHFAVGIAAQNAYTDLDKAMLARLSTLEATGIYGSAYRVISVGFLPLMALLGATYSRFFSFGEHGFLKAREFAWRIMPITAIYGFLAGIGIWVSAPWVAEVLGNGFSGTAKALELLAPLVLIQGLQYPLADALTGSGFQTIRSLCQLAAFGINLLLNFWFIPLFGWRGAAWATLLTQVILLLFLLMASLVLGRRKSITVSESKESY